MAEDIEIRIYKTQANFYSVELTFVSSVGDSVVSSSAEDGSALDLARLIATQTNFPLYTRELTNFVFKPGSPVQNLFLAAANKIASDEKEGKIRLYISKSAVELQTLRWELLGHPGTFDVLATSQRMLFSRYLYSRDFKPVKLRPKGILRCLLAVSALYPNTRNQFALGEIDEQLHIAPTRVALGTIPSDEIGVEQTLTLDQLFRSLRDREYDVLYLVGHGVSQPRSAFFIEQEDDHDGTGKRNLVTADELVTRFSELLNLPRLVVLASCQSGKDLAALGPRLVEAGVAAVVAMQGDISLETLAEFTKTFFEELSKSGKVDRAVAIARGAVRKHPDCWMPILFSRFREGQIWFEAGPSGTSSKASPNWRAIVEKAKSGGILPIIGPGLGEGVYGDVRDIARNIIQILKEKGYFVSANLLSDRSGLAQACQAVRASVKDVDLCRQYMFDGLRRQLLRFHGKLFTEGDLKKLSTLELLIHIGDQLRSRERDSYTLLARLEAKCFINANHDDLLFRALLAAGKKPRRLSPRWRKSPADDLPQIDGDPETATAEDLKHASPTSPIVYHVFGHFNEIDNVVLTEDDYFEYLIQTSVDRTRVPGWIRSLEVSNSLAFLGFHITDWNFRVLLHSILCQQGSAKLASLTHVAVQLDRNDESPVGHHTRGAYLKALLSNLAAGSEIFWGGPDDFLEQLLSDIRVTS